MKNHFSNASLDTKSSIAHIVMDQMLEIQILIWILIKLTLQKLTIYYLNLQKKLYQTFKKQQRRQNFIEEMKINLIFGLEF